MKVLHINDHYTERGGVEQYLLAVTHLLAEHGHSNVILYRHHTPHTIEHGAWPAYWVDGDERETVAAAVSPILMRERPDVAYIHHVASPALVETVADMLPAVAYVHGFAAVCPGLAKFYRRGDQVCQLPFSWGCVPMHYLRRCSAARRPSTLARLMRDTARLRQAYLTVPRLFAATPYMKGLLVQNGFSADCITLLPPHFLAPDDVPPYRPPEQPDTILYVGRLEIEKGVPYLLHALQSLPERVRLVMAGDGTLRGAYEKLAEDLRLTNRVDFLGWVDTDQMAKYYQQCALIVMPSICPESFGKTGIEALTYGRPVVAFAVGSIPDWLDDGAAGLLARPADTQDLASQIKSLLDDPARREAMGRYGQRIVIERYNAEHHLITLKTDLDHVQSIRA